MGEIFTALDGLKLKASESVPVKHDESNDTHQMQAHLCASTGSTAVLMNAKRYHAKRGLMREGKRRLLN